MRALARAKSREGRAKDDLCQEERVGEGCREDVGAVLGRAPGEGAAVERGWDWGGFLAADI